MFKNILSKLQNGINFGIGASIIFILLGAVYAAITPINEVTTGTTLQAAEYNKLVQKLNRIDEKAIATAWVHFDGTTTPPTIKDQFNVSNIERTGNGYYKITFQDIMNNNTYNTTGNAGTNAYRNVVFRGGTDRTTGYVIASILNVNTNNYENDADISIQIFGGKN